MLKTRSPSQSLGISLLFFNVAKEDEIRRGGSNNIKSTITYKKSIRADYLSFKGTVGVKDFGYLTLDAKKTFNHLRHAFIQMFILEHFNLERHIWVEIDMSDHAISGVLSQLTLDNLGQWHSMTYYSQKITIAKTWYKTHDGEFLAIIEAFKIWWHYLKDCKHKVLVLINHNNLYHFIATKSLSFCQVRWAQEFFRYHF